MNTSISPVDIVSRGATVKLLIESDWLKGPAFMKTRIPNPWPPKVEEIDKIDKHELEIRRQVNVHATNLKKRSWTLGTKRFKRFSSWSKHQPKIIFIVSKLLAQKINPNPRETTKSTAKFQPPPLETKKRATTVIVEVVQSEIFSDEVETNPKADIA